MIGVVVTVRDQAEFLGEALDSVAAQRAPSAAVVVVDDGSVDGSGDLARARGVRVLETGGRGPGAARNAGAAALATPLLAFLDADDRYTPCHHEALLAALGDGPVACGAVREFLDPRREAELRGRFAIETTPRTGRLAGTTLVTRDAFASAGGFAEDPGLLDALGLFRRLGAPATTGEVVLERRIHGANRSIALRERTRAQYLASARQAILERRRRA